MFVACDGDIGLQLSGRENVHKLMAVGVYMKTIMKIKVYGIAFYMTLDRIQVSICSSGRMVTEESKTGLKVGAIPSFI